MITLTDFWDKVKRNFVPIMIGLVGMLFLWNYYGKFFWEYTSSLAMIAIAESMALILSNLAVYIFTKIDFTNKIIYGDDKKLNTVEQHALLSTIGYIFLGVHFLVGIGLVGIYIANFK